MSDPIASLLKGTLDLLVLRTLELQPLHGAAIAERIFQTTRGTFQIKAGSLFPALHRLEQNGLVEGEWEMPARGRRIKSYRLTFSRAPGHCGDPHAPTTIWTPSFARMLRRGPLHTKEGASLPPTRSVPPSLRLEA